MDIVTVDKLGQGLSQSETLDDQGGPAGAEGEGCLRLLMCGRKPDQTASLDMCWKSVRTSWLGSLLRSSNSPSPRLPSKTKQLSTSTHLCGDEVLQETSHIVPFIHLFKAPQPQHGLPSGLHAVTMALYPLYLWLYPPPPAQQHHLQICWRQNSGGAQWCGGCESTYVDEMEHLTMWCRDNNCLLNTTKTKEVTVDFRM